MTRPRWKKADARAQILALAETVAEAFNVERPAPMEKDAGTREWEFTFDVPRVWTDCGPARLSVDISANFAHLFFRFEDTRRAYESLTYARHRLNHYSGKWNTWESPRTGTLEGFAGDVTGSIYAVAEPNPDPAAVAAFEKKEAEAAKYWAQHFEQWRADIEAKNQKGVTV